MRVVILSARSGWHTDELCRALADRGHAADVQPYESLVARIGRRAGLRSWGAPFQARPGGPDKVRPTNASVEGDRLPSPEAVADHCRLGGGRQVRLDERPRVESLLDADAVLARIIPDGSLEQIVFRVDVLHWLEDRGVPVVNTPRAIERSVDKFYTSALLHEAGLPTPETVVCEDAAQAMAAVRELGDAVIKPIFGSMGHGLVRVSDPEVALRVVRALDRTRTVFYVQRAIDHGGRDVRVFVVGGRVLAAIERRSLDGDWRTNVARGAAALPIDLPAAWADLAARAAAAVGADYAGVDLLPATDGTTYVLEVNGIPGWRGLQQATGVDVAAALVAHLETRITAPGAGRPAAVPA